MQFESLQMRLMSLVRSCICEHLAAQFLLGLSTMAVWLRLPLGAADEEAEEEGTCSAADDTGAASAAGMSALT